MGGAGEGAALGQGESKGTMQKADEASAFSERLFQSAYGATGSTGGSGEAPGFEKSKSDSVMGAKGEQGTIDALRRKADLIRSEGGDSSGVTRFVQEMLTQGGTSSAVRGGADSPSGNARKPGTNLHDGAQSAGEIVRPAENQYALKADYSNGMNGDRLRGGIRSEGPGSDNSWRPVGAREEFEKLTAADKAMLSRLESSFLSGNLRELGALMERIRPNADANITDRTTFEHAFNVFQLELTSLGFDAKYDKNTGALQIDNQQQRKDCAMFQRLIIDPVRHQLIASRKDFRNLTQDTLQYDTKAGSAAERCTQFGPPLRQFTAELPPDKIQGKYGDVLKDQVAVRLEAIEHQRLEETSRRQKELVDRLNEEDRQQRTELARQQEDQRLQRIIDEQMRRMPGELAH